MNKWISVLNPVCNIPLFQQTELSNVETCGKWNGVINAGIISFVLIILYWFFFVVLIKKQSSWVWISLVLLLLLIWICFPRLFLFIYKQRWKGFQYQIDTLKQNGFSHKEAISKIQSLYENDLQNTRPNINPIPDLPFE